MNNQPNKFITVIVPVFNDSKKLKLCLNALENQTYPKHLYEVIVVDNASEEDIKSVSVCFAQTKFCYEGCPGSYTARNKGISLAKGEILAFTDSDCIPASDWIEKGVNSLLNIPNCGLVAGKIDLFFQNPDRPTSVEIFESIYLNFPQQEKLQNLHYGMTANIFTFRHIFDDVGYFDGTLKSGGDRQWGQRVFAAGYKQVYADDVRVAHPARHSLSQLRKRVARLTGGKFDRMMSHNPSTTEIVGDLVETFKPPFRSLYHAWTIEELKNIQQKLQFIFIMLFVRYVVIVEKLRLYLGGNSQRG
ncbi:glycosyltransferase family 2 protein [Nostocaceae cyanobacterium CENA357]|uniref:Glycosyltransferase family 2 protein n=1 Tax=Atlanticothrix silvestris CENA357 TaxID=1725252 RepID=A0A8J7L1D2_9CYAN|nr:glycosyltransferase family A protein [Atlanticothrix silvestris]MBH8551087.1 glycosyltransferase family 2 protein [Atlanticothrix silvestris CENA357]